MSAKPAWRARCRAKNRRGTRCHRWALPGGYTCKLHGGASPKARKAAAARLLELFHTGADVVETELPQLDPHARAQLGVAAMRIALAAGVVPGTTSGPSDAREPDSAFERRQRLEVLTDDELNTYGAALEAIDRFDQLVAERLAARTSPALLPAASLPPIDVTPSRLIDMPTEPKVEE